MKSAIAIKRELNKASDEIQKKVRACKRGGKSRSERVEGELYGARQALSWALGQNAMAPVKCALLTEKKGT